MAVEYIGSAMSAHNLENIILYNCFMIIEFTFYLSFFRTLFPGHFMKKIITLTIVLYLTFTVTNVFFIQGRQIYQSYTYDLGCTLMVIFSVCYFYFLFRFPESNSLTKNPSFWIVTGVMFFYTLTFALYGLGNIITEKIGYYTNLLTAISDLSNILLYTLFSIGFLCKIKFRKLLPSS